jgi:DNA invertase Pin-like site-specific DNA recombinase
VKTAAYARVSTGRQDLEVQLEEIRQFAARKGWTLVATYADVASGSREDRIDFRRLLADAAKGKLEVVIVQRFDRAARSVKQLVETLEHLRRCRASFVSLKEDVDTSTPAGELTFHVMAAIGQFERALIGDRIRSGLERAKALGKMVGRPRVQVSGAQVLALRVQGLSYRDIGRRLQISPALAHRLAQAIPTMDSTRRSETSPARFETGPEPSVSAEAVKSDPVLTSGNLRNP